MLRGGGCERTRMTSRSVATHTSVQRRHRTIYRHSADHSHTARAMRTERGPNAYITQSRRYASKRQNHRQNAELSTEGRAAARW